MTEEEKFQREVLVQLHTLATKVDGLSATVAVTRQEEKENRQSLIKELATMDAENRQVYDAINTLLLGGTSPERGLVIRVDRIEQQFIRVGWLVKVVISAAVAALVQGIWQAVTR